MRTFIHDQTKRGGYGTASEFLRTLIRDAQKRQAEDRLEAMLLEGLDSANDPGTRIRKLPCLLPRHAAHGRHRSSAPRPTGHQQYHLQAHVAGPPATDFFIR